MPGPYTYTRQADGPGNIIYAARVNELQEAIEGIGIRLGSQFVAGQRYGPGSTFPGTSTSSITVTANRLYVVPFFTGPIGITFTNININVATLAAGNARLGIYAAATTAPYYPAGRILDAGEVVTGTTGVKTIDITDALYIGTVPSRLIWLAAVFQVAPTVGAISQIPLIEIDSVGQVMTGLYMTHTYAALPSTFTLTATASPVPHLWTVAG